MQLCNVMRYMFWYLEKNCVFSAALNLSSLSVGSWRVTGREFRSSSQQQKMPNNRTCCNDVVEQSAGSGWQSKDADAGVIGALWSSVFVAVRCYWHVYEGSNGSRSGWGRYAASTGLRYKWWMAVSQESSPRDGVAAYSWKGYPLTSATV